MTRDDLLTSLLLERYGTSGVLTPRQDGQPEPDNELSTVRRRRELSRALDGFDVPQRGPRYLRKTKEAS